MVSSLPTIGQYSSNGSLLQLHSHTDNAKQLAASTSYLTTTTTTQFPITSPNRIDRSISTVFNSRAMDDVATCVSVAPKIRSFPKIFLGTFENAAPEQ